MRASTGDAVVLEVRLRDGFAYRLIDEMAERGIVVAVLTRCGSCAGRRDAVRRGASAYLRRPAEFARVVAALRGEREFDFYDPPRSLDDRSREQLHEALCEQDWSVSRAACALGITRRSLQRRLSPPPHVQVRQTATATLPSHFDPRDRFRLAS